MKIIAIKDMADGNESVGEMWQETKIFEGTTPLEEVIGWACGGYTYAGPLRKRLTLTLPDGETFTRKEIT